MLTNPDKTDSIVVKEPKPILYSSRDGVPLNLFIFFYLEVTQFFKNYHLRLVSTQLISRDSDSTGFCTTKKNNVKIATGP
jgi:hypothetical protein